MKKSLVGDYDGLYTGMQAGLIPRMFQYLFTRIKDLESMKVGSALGL